MSSATACPGAFARLWWANAVSAFGSFIGSLALAFTVVETLGGSTASVAALAVAGQVSAMAVAAHAGLLADRLPARRALVAADLVRAAALICVPLAHRLGLLHLGLLLAVSAVTGAANVLFNSAAQGLVPALVPAEGLVRANSRLASATAAAEIAGFALAGVLADRLGPPGAVTVDALSFVASAVCLAALPPALRARPRRPRRRASLSELLAGFAFVRNEPVLRSLLATAALADIGTAFASVSYLVYLAGEVGFAGSTLGVIFAIGGATAIVGARVATMAERRRAVGRAYALAAAVRVVGSAAMPAAADTGAVGIGLLVTNQVVTDPAWMLQEVAESAIRQARTPDELAGRVAAVGQWLGSGSRLAGTATAGAVGAVVGPRPALWAGCAVLTAAAVTATLTPVVRVRSAAGAGAPLSAAGPRA